MRLILFCLVSTVVYALAGAALWWFGVAPTILAGMFTVAAPFIVGGAVWLAWQVMMPATPKGID